MMADVFYHNVCPLCDNSSMNNVLIMKCSRCRLISYCSVEHQKSHWPNHKELCNIIKKLAAQRGSNAIFDSKEKNLSEWNQHQVSVMCYIEILLKRKMNFFERQMLMFPNVCYKCYKFNLESFHCQSCFASYCCKEHLEMDYNFHSSICKQLKLCFEIDMFMKGGNSSLGEFFHKSTDFISFPKNTEEYIEQYIEGVAIEGFAKRVLFSEPLSFILTLIYGCLCEENKFTSLTEIIIHLIGSSEQEKLMIPLLKIIFYWLPNLEKVDLLLLGPECPKNVIQSELNSNASPVITIRTFTDKLYHEFGCSNHFYPPNVIAAFNCGFSESAGSATDTWAETVNFILHLNNVLLITTSYTNEEAVQDFSVIIKDNFYKSKVNIIKHAEKNPFRSLRPYRNWEKLDIFYQNSYLSVIKINP